jgi:hypothetical protein
LETASALDYTEDSPPDLEATDLEVDFEKIKARVEQDPLLLLELWFPEGTQESGEFCIGNVQGDVGKSLKFNLRKGVWKDFAEEGSHGDIISLNAARLKQVHGRDFTMSEAALDIEQTLDQLGIEPSARLRPVQASPQRPAAPVPASAEMDESQWQQWCRQHRVPHLTAHWEYRDSEGRLMLYVIRYEGTDGKQIRPVTWDGDQWRMVTCSRPRPLYGLDRLAARPDDFVLLTEGEKAADGARKYFPGLVVMTWMNGADGVNNADWTPLHDRVVYLWPDNDQSGRKAMKLVSVRLEDAKAASIRMVPVPETLPDGWDLADPVPAGVDVHGLLATATPPPASGPESKPESDSEGDGLLAALESMNLQHFVAREKGRTWVYNVEQDVLFKQRRTVLTMSSFGDHRNFYLNRQFLIKSGNKTAVVDLGGYWLKWQKRREYIGITLDPHDTPAGYYNLWRGFSAEPKPGSWERFREHIFENICCANQTHYDYLMRWVARLFQRPDEAGQVAIVLGGEEGSGKGFFVRALGHLFGQHFVHISSQSHLVGKFNSHQRDAILLFADESFWAGDRQGASALKRLITEPTLMIEAKGKDAIAVPNMLHLILASNDDWIVPARWGARRFFVLKVGNKHLRDKPWFEQISSELNAGGYEAFLHDMLSLDISRYQVEDFPHTEWLQQQKQFTMENHETWWLRKLETGNLLMKPRETTGDWAAGEVCVATEDLYADYSDAMKQVQERYPKAENVFGIFLRGVFRPWSEQEGKKEEWPLKRRDKSARKTWYRFPRLEDCRKAFEMYTKSPWNWPKEDAMPM